MVEVQSEEEIERCLREIPGHSGEQCKLDYGDLECLSMLGEGPVSEIYKARMKERFSRRFPDHLIFRIVGGTDRQFAVKVINRRKVQVNRNSAQMIGMVLREKKAMYRLRDQPFVLRIFATAKNDRVVCFITEFCEHKDMRALLESYGALSVDALVYYASCMIDTLCVVHSRGMAHRDIKPENVLITRDWRPKLTDFGCVKLLFSTSLCSRSGSSISSSSSSSAIIESSEVPSTPMPLLAVDGSGLSEHERREEERKKHESQADTDFVGTPEFMAPEIMTAHELDRDKGQCLDYLSLDLWSLGMMFYQWATAKLLISEGSEYLTLQAVAKWAGPLDRHSEELSTLVHCDDDPDKRDDSDRYREWFDIVDALLQREPSERMSLKDLRKQPMFADVNWDDLQNVHPPRFNAKAPLPPSPERAVSKDPSTTDADRAAEKLSDALATALLFPKDTVPVVFKPDDCD